MLFVFVFLTVALGGLLVLAYSQYKTSAVHLRRAHAELSRFQGIKDLESYKTQLQTRLDLAQEVVPKFETLADLERHRISVENTINQLESREEFWRDKVAAQEITLNRLLVEVTAVEDKLEIQSFGIYEPKYGFEDSEHYAIEIKKIRDQQKEMIKQKTATHCSQDWTVEGSVQKGQKMVNEQSKLMLRAFNNECSTSILKVKYNNVESMENRINRAFEQINKLGKSKSLFITNNYLQAKLKELYLVHEHQDRLNFEKEEQRRIKEQMREEERAQREFERAKKQLESEQKAKETALAHARLELSNAHDEERSELNQLIARLEEELEEALRKKERAIARAQLTRSGHVYIISNIGVFGENVYKIGMTRRLEPMDRVKELGDASVPFPFDVHAMIYSEDAPALENALHKVFHKRRLNLVNLRREFFSVGLESIKQEIFKEFPDAHFVDFAEAEEYRRSNSMRESYTEQNIEAVETQLASPPQNRFYND